jgi:hypothetical protein
MEGVGGNRNARDAVIVAAGQWAYACFLDFARSDNRGEYTAYIC